MGKDRNRAPLFLASSSAINLYNIMFVSLYVVRKMIYLLVVRPGYKWLHNQKWICRFNLFTLSNVQQIRIFCQHIA